MQHRTPEQHRADTDKWRANAPENDRDIFHEISKKSKSPRHASLADQLAPLLQWMRKPEGVMPGESKPEADITTTNWAVVPDNDNIAPKGFRMERGVEITPSIEEIERAIQTGEVTRNEGGQIIGIGGLRFSDGKAFERGYKRGVDGKVVQSDVRMPVGSMLGTRERSARPDGAEEDPDEIRESNAYFLEMFGLTRFKRIPGRRKKVRGKSYSATQSQQVLDKAIANTDVMPKVKYFRPGLPSAGTKIADSFLGMKKTTCAGNGSQAWEDVCSAMVSREIWAETIAALPKHHIDVLDRAMSAENMQAIGSMIGYTGKRAERQGKRALIAANDNLATMLKNFAA